MTHITLAIEADDEAANYPNSQTGAPKAAAT
jgi:hypothetical protein